MNTATHRGLKNSFALRLWAMALMLSFGASAQAAFSADAASVARQWLAMANADTAAAMQEQSMPVVKGTEIQTARVQKRESAGAGGLPMWAFAAVPPAAK